ncbi:MAG: Flp pilus assembly protein CpaB, partial [Caulobacteraceae bacterium]|nr:Flp pilus assembly protein CpaB [Caulobacteraceae bacterium]
MGAIRLVTILLVAAVAAIVLALVVRHMTASRSATAMAAAPPARPAVRVLVAKHDMKVGDRLAAEDVAWQTWPADAVNPAFVTGGPVDPKANIADKAEAALQAATGGDPAVQALGGSLVREAVLTNEPISKRKLVKGGEGGFMAVKLPQGMRALSLPVTVETGAGGFVLPGDHVDVVLNVKMTGGGGQGGPAQPVQSRTVMRNLTVLAIDQTTEPKAGASSLVGAVATLEVPAEDVDELAKAKDEGTLLLALRSYADMGGPAGRAAPA